MACLFKLGFDLPLPQQVVGDQPTAAADGDDVDPIADSSLITANYRIVEKLGEGGCGIVYRAEQLAPVRRQVALKVIKLGMDTKAVVARFEAERQVLALMNHLNIAKVYDAGATAAGRPYFVMELVSGVKITDYCDRHKLSLRERLALFLQVCQAVQHAHQKGIIHRDLKPSNILVSDEEGAPVCKIIDFGIAKATVNQHLADERVFTALEQFVGTPAYMSPEQAGLQGSDIDTRSDIYSLGVLLYELLSGKVPFDPIRRGLKEIRRVISEEDPIRPSTRLSTLKQDEQTTLANLRSSSPPKLINLIRGDLDWVVMKCLEKDRVRRYGTATGLIDDILHHLNNEPVSARPPTNFYRFRKLIVRHKVSFSVGACMSVTIIAAASISFWMYVREARAHKQAVVAERTARNQTDQLVELIKLMMPGDFSSGEKVLRQALQAQNQLSEGDVSKSAAALRQLEITREQGDKPIAQAKLTDGRILEIDALTFGTNHHVGIPAPLEQMYPWLPRELRKLVAPKHRHQEYQSDHPSLIVWLMAVDGVTGNYVDPQDIHTEIISGSGECSCGSHVIGNLLRSGYMFDWYPMADRMLTIQMTSKKTKSSVQVVVPNPHVARPTNWIPKALPIREAVGGIDMVLSGLSQQTNRGDCGKESRFWRPIFELRKGGKEAVGWEDPLWFAEDPVGNHGYHLPMDDTMLRYSATFYPSPTNIEDVAVIGSSPPLSTGDVRSNIWWNLSLNGDRSSAIALGLFTPGTHVFLEGGYQTNPPVSALRNPSKSGWGIRGEIVSPGVSRNWVCHYGPLPVIIVGSLKLKTEDRIRLRLRDEEGRYWPTTADSTKDFLAFPIKLPPGVKSAVAEFVLLRPINAQFTVETPRP